MGLQRFRERGTRKEGLGEQVRTDRVAVAQPTEIQIVDIAADARRDFSTYRQQFCMTYLNE